VTGVDTAAVATFVVDGARAALADNLDVAEAGVAVVSAEALSHVVLVGVASAVIAGAEEVILIDGALSAVITNIAAAAKCGFDASEVKCRVVKSHRNVGLVSRVASCRTSCAKGPGSDGGSSMREGVAGGAVVLVHHAGRVRRMRARAGQGLAGGTGGGARGATATSCTSVVGAADAPVLAEAISRGGRAVGHVNETFHSHLSINNRRADDGADAVEFVVGVAATRGGDSTIRGDRGPGFGECASSSAVPELENGISRDRGNADEEKGLDHHVQSRDR